MKFKQNCLRQTIIATLLILGIAPLANADLIGLNVGVLGGASLNSTASTSSYVWGASVNYRLPISSLQVGAEFLSIGGQPQIVGKLDYYILSTFFVGALAGQMLSTPSAFVYGAESAVTFDLGGGFEIGPKIEVNVSSPAGSSIILMNALGFLRYGL
jgi:hypothetical protein